MVGVDPYRIATYKIDVENTDNISVIIPAKLIIEVAKFIDDDGESKMSFEIVDNKVILKFNNNKATRPSSGFILGPYVLKMRMTRISVPRRR